MFLAVDNNGLYVADISNPASPIFLGRCDTPDQALDVTTAGTYAFVADGESGLQIIDISNPAAPQLVGSYDTPFYAMGVKVADDHAFVADYLSIQAIDIRDPISPSFLSCYDNGGTTGAVVARDNVAYVTSHSEPSPSSNLITVNIEDASRPIPLQVFSDSLERVADILVSGDYAYLADSRTGLVIVDVSDPGDMSLVTAYDIGRYLYSIAISGNYVYLGHDSISVIDVSNPALPALIHTFGPNLFPQKLMAIGDHLYALSYGLCIFDVSAPQDPSLVGEFWDFELPPYDFDVDGPYAYVLTDDWHGQGDVEIIDISYPQIPDPLSRYVLPEGGYGIEVDGNFAYIADSHAGVLVLHVADPTQPTIAGRFATQSYCRDIALADSNICVIDGYSLTLLHFTSPQGSTETPGNLPAELILYPNYPNPFNSRTTIEYALPYETRVRLEIFDINGKKVARLQDGPLKAGRHQVTWNALGLGSGIYFVRLSAGDLVETQKALLLK
jgi:hypothetical protein